jgi:hypothetical protein
MMSNNVFLIETLDYNNNNKKKIIILPLMTKTFDSVGGVIRSFIIFEQ